MCKSCIDRYTAALDALRVVKNAEESNMSSAQANINNVALNTLQQEVNDIVHTSLALGKGVEVITAPEVYSYITNGGSRKTLV